MKTLAELLKQHHDRIGEYLYIGYLRWDDLIARVGRQEQKASHGLTDEQVWTFLVASGYAAAGEQGVAMLTEAMTDSNQKDPASSRIWLEVLPVSPRKKEGETHVDLALGTIAIRAGTESGIELHDAESPWVCFCEAKWYSDISTGVSYDIHRNQLARVVENAVCFQRAGAYLEHAYVTLLTPEVFRRASLKSRLYQYLFKEYNEDRVRLTGDLAACALEKTEQPDWTYPSDVAKRAATLSLQWCSYDELFERMPDSQMAASLYQFWRLHGDYQGRPS